MPSKIYSAAANTDLTATPLTSVFTEQGPITHVIFSLQETDAGSKIYSSDPLAYKTVKMELGGETLVEPMDIRILLAAADHAGGAVNYYNTPANSAVYRAEFNLPIGLVNLAGGKRLTVYQTDSQSGTRAAYNREHSVAREYKWMDGIKEPIRYRISTLTLTTTAVDFDIDIPGCIGAFIWDPSTLMSRIQSSQLDLDCSGQALRIFSMTNANLSSIGNQSGAFWNMLHKLKLDKSIINSLQLKITGSSGGAIYLVTMQTTGDRLTIK